MLSSYFSEKELKIFKPKISKIDNFFFLFLILSSLSPLILFLLDEDSGGIHEHFIKSDIFFLNLILWAFSYTVYLRHHFLSKIVVNEKKGFFITGSYFSCFPLFSFRRRFFFRDIKEICTKKRFIFLCKYNNDQFIFLYKNFFPQNKEIETLFKKYIKGDISFRKLKVMQVEALGIFICYILAFLPPLLLLHYWPRPLYNTHFSVISNNKKHLLESLKSHDHDINKKDSKGRTPVHYAILHPHLLSLLIEKKANIHIKDKKSHTPLHLASIQGKKETIQILLENKADLKAKDKNGYTPLHLSSLMGHEDVTFLFLKHGASVHEKNKEGHTPLHLASLYGYRKVASLLLKEGASLQATNKSGQTPLHVASLGEQKDMVLFLLDKGASMNKKDAKGKTALDHARENKCSRAVASVLEKRISKKSFKLKNKKSSLKRKRGNKQ